MQILRKFTFIVFLSIFILSLFLGSAYSQEGKISSKYFTITYDRGCDLTGLASKLYVKHFLHIDLFSKRSSSRNIDSIIANLFDSIFLEVSDILDIHIYSYHGKIKIVSSKRDLADAIYTYARKRLDLPSFYYHPDNIIYISYADLTLGMLAHEIAHAIISHYFVVPPPKKVQEVLAGYVEYSIRKITGTLPSRRK